MKRKTRFWFGFVIVALVYSLPLAGLLVIQAIWHALAVLMVFVFSVYLLYRFTIKNVRPKYPIVPPEGHPDIYTGRMPRPIYEDMERYPWLFNKKQRKKIERYKKVKKK